MPPSYNLIVRVGKGAQPHFEAKWRAGGKQFKRRLGPAWLEAGEGGGWVPRKGRVKPGYLDERFAHALARDAIAEVEFQLAHADQLAREKAERGITVRELAHEWMEWQREVKQIKPATLVDYHALLREPGAKYARGSRVTHGRMMKALGDRPINRVTTREISDFLRSLDRQGLSARNVNKHRQVLATMFRYACREDTYNLPKNPVDPTDKRPEPPPAALDYFEVEEAEALARAAAAGHHRWRERDELAIREDLQDAELYRVLFYTGLRVGEAVVLRWDDVDLAARTILVRRGLSATTETLPKGRRYRFVPLAQPAVEALARLADRGEFISPDDYVFCNVWGRRIDISALRRRYKRACDAAGLRPVKLHGLRHAAGSIVARTTDPVFVRDMLGHAKLTTTDRYLGAKLRPEELAKLDAAFAPVTIEA
jgi:integrase